MVTPGSETGLVLIFLDFTAPAGTCTSLISPQSHAVLTREPG